MTRALVSQLFLDEKSLAPGGEWLPQAQGWLVASVVAGAGYWLHPARVRELPTGSVLLASPQVEGRVRSSQVGPMKLLVFAVFPEQLTGVLALGEQRYLQNAAARPELASQVFPPNHEVSRSFERVRLLPAEPVVFLRLTLIELFLRAFAPDLPRVCADVETEPEARERLAAFLNRMPAASLLDFTSEALARELHCTPRHLNRIFRSLYGLSFREKQTEIRLARARELLSTTRARMVDVALESGFQTQSLFNLMFKRRFGVSPSKWRETLESKKKQRKLASRLPALEVGAA